MSGIKRYEHSHVETRFFEDPEGNYVLHTDHAAQIARLRAEVEKVRGYEVAPLEAKVAELRDEVEVLRNALTPFAEFALVRSAAGSTSPKTGPVYSVHTRLGEAEITAEDFEAAFNAIGASA